MWYSSSSSLEALVGGRAGVPLRGESDLKNCWDSYSHGSAAWPYAGLPVQERSFGAFRSEDWLGLCSFITCMRLQCLLGREVIGMGVWSMTHRAQRAVPVCNSQPWLASPRVSSVCLTRGYLKDLRRVQSIVSFRSCLLET